MSPTNAANKTEYRCCIKCYKIVNKCTQQGISSFKYEL